MKRSLEQALIDMGRRKAWFLSPPNENSEQVVNDVLAVPAPVQQKYDKNKMSLRPICLNQQILIQNKTILVDFIKVQLNIF